MVRLYQMDGSRGNKESGGQKMSMGIVMMTAGIVGMLGSMVLLCIFPHIFEKQRKKLLSEIEREF